MRILIKTVIILSILTGVVFLSYPYVMDKIPSQVEERIQSLLPESLKKTVSYESESELLTTQNGKISLKGTEWIGRSKDEVLSLLGNPKAMNLSRYGYTWYSYSTQDQILEIGIDNEEVVTIFIAGDTFGVEPFQFLQDRNQLSKDFTMERIVKFKKGIQSFEFVLTEEDYMVKPIILLGNQLAQLYFDRETDELVGVRYGTKDVFIMQKPYQMRYTGELLTASELSTVQMNQVNQTREKQIYIYTNFIRKLNGCSTLKLKSDLSQISFLHSQDMEQNQFFSHESPNTGTLKDRLEQGNYPFQAAGENIAANYTDGLDVTVGWLNSPGHRVNLLSKEFNEIGIGVSGSYYTQNFSKNT
ncbi:MAG: hypothetical protein IJX07_01765 [Bacillales bacterium]|nr:hypothetical protein [Bacillales bacterium]